MLKSSTKVISAFEGTKVRRYVFLVDYSIPSFVWIGYFIIWLSDIYAYDLRTYVII